MGKFIITVSGCDCKNEIISERYFVDNGSEETKAACRALYDEQWAHTHYHPYNIEVECFDVEAAARNFTVSEKDMENVKRIIENNRKVSIEAEKNEIETLKRLKEKYPDIA